MASNPKKAFIIEHVATGAKTFLSTNQFAVTEYSDNINTRYSETEVYGRMDPIVTYQGTDRKINFSLNLKKVFDSEPFGENLTLNLALQRKIERGAVPITTLKAIQAFQYPTFRTISNALSISRPPLVKIQLSGFIKEPLLCAMNGFTYAPTVGIDPSSAPVTLFGRKASNNASDDGLLDVSLEFINTTISFDLRVLHEQTVGFNDASPSPDADASKRWLGQFKDWGA